MLEQASSAFGDLAFKHALARLLATCPDHSVRDGERATRLAEQVMNRQLTLQHAETMAMALAEVGRFDEALALQNRVLDQARRGGHDSGSEHSERLSRARAYQEHRPIRAPWSQE